MPCMISGNLHCWSLKNCPGANKCLCKCNCTLNTNPFCPKSEFCKNKLLCKSCDNLSFKLMVWNIENLTNTKRPSRHGIETRIIIISDLIKHEKLDGLIIFETGEEDKDVIIRIDGYSTLTTRITGKNTDQYGGETYTIIYKNDIVATRCIIGEDYENHFRGAVLCTFTFQSSNSINVCALHAPSPVHKLNLRLKHISNCCKLANKDTNGNFIFCGDFNIKIEEGGTNTLREVLPKYDLVDSSDFKVTSLRRSVTLIATNGIGSQPYDQVFIYGYTGVLKDLYIPNLNAIYRMNHYFENMLNKYIKTALIECHKLNKILHSHDKLILNPDINLIKNTITNFGDTNCTYNSSHAYLAKFSKGYYNEVRHLYKCLSNFCNMGDISKICEQLEITFKIVKAPLIQNCIFLNKGFFNKLEGQFGLTISACDILLTLCSLENNQKYALFIQKYLSDHLGIIIQVPVKKK
ncbi:MAG: hypothetical protein KAR42_13790 [candidate division Zixibacteria bacterium]|nr:hypothetical protein [candidate division Zixibacteria bacterium]